MTSATQVLNAVLGTAGHIDHGKSSLVKALTGTDPDRFREEQERGMTIDIGFAEYRTPAGVDVGLIDVPGHERFVRNMVAGATGMDMVMLVIAADDSVMPQTREHLEIMTILGLQRGFVVLTKIDMVDGEMVDLVEEDVREFVAGTFLQGAPIVRCSSVTGEGIDRVRSLIDGIARDLPGRDHSGVFRMPIQRCFTIKGHGTVVTGIPLTGEIHIGDTLEVLPRGLSGRVRGLQVHHRPAESAGAGHRSAINLTDVGYRDISRGDVLALPGFFSATTLVEARMTLLPSWRGPLKNNVPVRVHAGCAEVMGRLVLLDCKRLEPGEDALVQMRLEEPLVVAPGDHYLVRLASPELTLGGGLVLGETRFRFKRFKDWITENMAGKEASLGDRRAYLEYVIRSEGLHPIPIDRLPQLVKDSRLEVEAQLAALKSEGVIIELSGRKQVLHRDMVRRGAKDLEKALLSLHEGDHYPFGFPAQAIASRMKHPVPVVELFLEEAVEQKNVQTQGGVYRLKAFKSNVSNEDRRLLGAIERTMFDGGYATPLPADIAQELARPKKRVENVLTLLEQWGRVVKLADNIYLHAKWVKAARDLLVEHCETHGEIPSSTMKDVVGATRKYVIPLLEYFDLIGLTVRKDSSRLLKDGYEAILKDEIADPGSAVEA